ncbi:FYVE and coiled-coil domain-containing protein 1 [Puntigrus tetrazona]|uniref:FYVE and coiled-coil domain-containing protein 1 n=1 Tax=Puntigrus tetrazona TaxID=1606681 RepID=UPI001C8A4ACA|nr:FYVE and coiled-coil domain-containing protein 1 [Puntigrus tetrazona]XP_043086134.1 FYVE and coiled-coil domain-containing protein 1 [Puntigrus tetrazona]XP_043086135.1 FYVE and coiled-coil domain-containing protein 1 [Puntigrus tetrazona]
MAAGAAVGEGQIQRIIRDLHDAVSELTKEYRENGEPITDDSSNLHKFSYKLEYLLQFDQKEKTTFLGSRKDYWDYFSDCLAKIKGANDGIRFVKSIAELKTSLGKGRAFIRYSLVHQRLADTLQQCLMNHRVTSDWYNSRSPFLKPHLSVDIINYLYELNDVQFDVASRGHDLDSEWPTFARRTLGMTSSPSHTWKPPSRSSSINSLASTYSQQAHEFPGSPDFGPGLLSDMSVQNSSGLNDSSISAIDELRLELDQSELKQRDLLDQVQQLGSEAGELRGVVVELQRQLDVSLAAQGNHQEIQRKLEMLAESERALSHELVVLRGHESVREASYKDLQDMLAVAERKNEELMARLDGVLDEKGQRAASDFNSAQKIHELLNELKEAEKGRIDALAEGEERRRQTEQLAEKVKMKDEALKEAEVKMAAWMMKGEQLQTRAEEHRNVMDKLQGALAVREKETSNLQKQLQDLQHSLETMEKQAKVERKEMQEDKEELEKKMSGLEEQLQTLRTQLKAKESNLLSSTKRVQFLEKESEKLKNDKQSLRETMSELENKTKEQTKKIGEYKDSCAKLMEESSKLLQMVSKNEETKKELLENKSSLESELAGLKASEKQLRAQIDDAKVTVDEREKRLREENRNLDESLHKANMQLEESESSVRQLKLENKDLMEVQVTLKASLAAMQEEIRNINSQIAELEKSLGAVRCNEANLTAQLKDKDSQFEDREKLCEELQGKVEELEGRERDLEVEKTKAERAFVKQSEMIKNLETQRKAAEKVQLEQSACQAKETQEMALKVNLLEDQLGLNVKEVSRLQEEVLDLRAKLHSAVEEKDKTQAKLEVTEASCAELRTLTEQLKKQAEEQNRLHVKELLQSSERVDAITSQLNQETSTCKKTTAELTSAQEVLAELKTQNEKLVLENAETREGLHRVNTEMAELGMTICKLTAEREEARQQWAVEAARFQELQQQGVKETERLNASLVALHQENSSLQEELQQTEKLSETVLEIKDLLDKTEGERDAAREEIIAVKFQMSTESMTLKNQIKSLNGEIEDLKTQLDVELKKSSELEAKLSELETVNIEYSRLIEEKDSHITDCETQMRERESEAQQLQESVSSSKEALSEVQKEKKELKQKLDQVLTDAQIQQLRMSAELEDLGQTKINLEERLIELIRDKDALWQKSDALEFEQKLRAEEQWWLVDKEATHCLGCQGQFTWWLRRHHCRLCGRIFCYYCSNNYVMTKNSKKERCCRECYTQHNAVVERFTKAELNTSSESQPPPHANAAGQPPPPYIPTPRVTVTDPEKPDDGAFDIITEEEVNEIYDSDSRTTTGSQEEEGDGGQTGDLSISSDMTPDEQEEMVPAAQDAEITLLKSGELTASVPLDIEEIPHFGDGSRELFVKSSCYSTIPITVGDCGPIISWVFSSEPKSISFTVVYRETLDTPVEQAKVLIPLTRCNSHKETIQGQLKVRNPGVYTLIFDNSFSRFLSKKVNYQLTIEKPIIYDGSDFP